MFSGKCGNDYTEDVMNNLTNISIFLQIVTALIFLFGLLPKLVGTLNKFFTLKSSFKKLKSTFTDYDIKKATELFIPTKGQTLVASQRDEEGEIEKDAEVKKYELIPYLIKKLDSICPEKFYLILASAGMGKTTFMINLFVKYDGRIFKKHKMKLMALNSRHVDAKIEAIEDKRNTILLLDAFDEDQQAINNYKKRMHALINKGRDFQAVIITSRIQFFSSEEDEPNSIDTEEFLSNLDGGEQEFQKLYMASFDKDDIDDFLRKKYPFYQKSKIEKAKSIIAKAPTIMTVPMLLRNIDVFVDDAKEEVFLFTHQVYEALINHWLGRKSKKIQDELKKFSQVLALDMYVNRKIRNGLYIDGSELKPFAVKSGIELTEDEMRSRSLLTRNVEGHYMFYHKSFLEYFLAKELVENKDSHVNFELHIREQTYIFYSEFYEKINKVKLVEDEEFYDILQNAVGALLISIRSRIGQPIDPRIVYDGGEHAMFYRNPGLTTRLDFVHLDARQPLKNAESILMVEFEKDEVIREYDVPVFEISELPDSILINHDRRDTFREIFPDKILADDHVRNAKDLFYFTDSVEDSEKLEILETVLNQVEDNDRVKLVETMILELREKDKFYYSKGMFEYQRGQSYDAMESFDKAIELNDELAGAYSGRGSIYYEQQEYDKALEEYDKAISISPDFDMAYAAFSNRAIIYFIKSNYAQSIADNSRAIELNNKYTQAYEFRGLAYEAIEEYDHALSDCDKAMELDTKSSTAELCRGRVYEAKGDNTKAIEHFNKAIELDPKNVVAYLDIGDFYCDRKEYKKAIENCNEAIKIYPGYALAYNSRGYYFNLRGKYKKAIKDFDKSIELDAKLSYPYNNRGNSYYYKKKYNIAINDFEKAIELDSKNGKAYNNLTKVQIILKQYQRALQTINTALPLFEKMPDKAICFYLKCVVGKMLDMDTSDSENQLEEIIKTGIKIHWSSDDISKWLKRVSIPSDKYEFIAAKTEILKNQR